MKEFLFLKANDKYAQYFSKESIEEKPVIITPQKHPYRSIFNCDRDRVMYSSAFRNLALKTQVFNSQSLGGLRTRLTHTLEVSQIARTISSQLGLDEELTEAIALGHDVGHTPFGHVGERTLNTFSVGKDRKQLDENVHISDENFGFKHNLQSVRVLIEYSENVKFSNYMLFGIREHSKLFWKSKDDVAFYNMYDPYCSYYNGKSFFPAWSFEAFVVKWADEIAQRHHDIEDAYLQKIMPPDDIVEKVKPLIVITNNTVLTKKYNRLKEETEKLSRKDFTTKQLSFAHTLSSFLVDAYVTILLSEFTRVLRHFSNINNIKSEKDFYNIYLKLKVDDIRETMSLTGSQILKADNMLNQSLKYSILDSYEVQRSDGKGAYIIRKLIRAYMSNPQQLPNEYINRFVKTELFRNLSENDRNTFMQERL